MASEVEHSEQESEERQEEDYDGYAGEENAHLLSLMEFDMDDAAKTDDEAE